MKQKRSYKFYPAWNYQREIEDLNQASAQGWQLVNGGCFHSKFVKNPGIRYRYQMDFRKVDDMGRYLETFREQGWEYVNSTFNGWHFFRKIYDPAMPEESYEIYTDRDSLHERNSRWAHFALTLSVICGIFALIGAVWMAQKPHLSLLIQIFVLAIECAVLLRGALLMRNPDSGRRNDGALFAVFLAVVIFGSAAQIALVELRPNFSSQQQADAANEPVTGNRWASFQVRYPDNYYLDLKVDADAPLTFQIVNDAGETVYDETGTSIDKEDVRIRLAPGQYWLSMSCEAGFRLDCSIN